MNVWCHLPTTLGVRRILRIFGVLALCVVLNTALFFASTTHAANGINQTLSFQGRLLNAAGNVVPDGYYNMQFKLYQDGDGQEAGDTGGTLDWTENYVNNGTSGGVQVTDGFFSVNLGSKNPFGTQVDWNQDTLWLSMNIAGTDASCSAFGSTGCTGDGEMTPMKRLTATPYALNAGMLGGRDASGFIQNNSGTAQTGDFNITGTGTADIIQGISSVTTPLLDSGTAGILSIGTVNASTIDIGTNNADHSISIGTGTGAQDITIGSATGSGSTVVQGSGSSVQLDTSGVNISSGVVGLISAKNNNGVANVGIGNDASSGYALDVTGDINSSTQYRIGGSTTLTNSSLSFSGASTSTVTSAGSQVLALEGSAGVTIESGSTTSATFGDTNIQIGSGLGTGTPMLLTLDTASTAPTGSAPIGSMYYDTAKGAVQCYNSDGWGSCTNTPDTFVSLSPEYTGAVIQGDGNGTMTNGICSDSLHINDGTNSQPTICGNNETYNFYKWTSSQTSSQKDHIYVSYQLPSDFSNFVSGSTSLMGRTDSSNSTVSYQLYRKSATGGLTACGSSVTASTGAQTSWQKGTASGSDDPSACSFAAGDTLFVDVIVDANTDANAYVSTLNFAYSSTH